MDRNILASIVCVFILMSCSPSQNTQEVQGNTTGVKECAQPLTLTGGLSDNLTLKAKVVTNDIKNILSNNGGNIETLNCEKGTKVSKNTLIAKITPDSSDPNIQNLMNQSNMVNTQIVNTKGIIASTQSNFDTQMNSLSIQKTNLESQLKILNDSYSKIANQGDYGVSDIDKQLDTLKIQLETLQTQIDDLNKLKSKLMSSKQADLDKINLNLTAAKSQVKTLFTSVLLQIDQIFGISDQNRNKNASFEIYLSARDTSLKKQVETDWRSITKKFQNYDSMSYSEISDFLGSLDNLAIESKNAINNSVSGTYFPDSTISAYYSAFVQYESGSLGAKSGIDNLLKSIETVGNSYDTQILNIDTQINAAQNSQRSVQTNIDNIQANKLGTYTTSVDIQKNQTQSQIESTQSNLNNMNQQMNALKSQEQIQLNQLNSQLTQLNSSLRTIHINLTSQSIYADVVGTVKEKQAFVGNKIGSNSLLCQILPDKSSLKLQVYSSLDLPLPLDITFVVDDKTYTTQLITKLPYQDTATQNFVYETSSDIFFNHQSIDISTLLSEGRVFDVSFVSHTASPSHDKIFIPLDYVNNTINDSYIKLQTGSGVIQQDVVLGELNSNQVEVRTGLKYGDTICR